MEILGVSFTDGRAWAAEGARVAIVVCERCSAAILLDPADPINRLVGHAVWHDAHDHAEGADQ